MPIAFIYAACLSGPAEACQLPVLRSEAADLTDVIPISFMKSRWCVIPAHVPADKIAEILERAYALKSC